MSNKITKIILENYRAFYGTETIDINGKNVLIYGENGSGKSSLYEGLKRCFESCSMPNAYFSTHLQASSPAKISLSFEDEPTPYDFDSNTPSSSAPFKQKISNAYKASGFLSYRELLRTHLMSNLYDEEIFEMEFAELLITQILAYEILIPPSATFLSVWERLNQPKINRSVKNPLLENFDVFCTQKLSDISAIANRILHYFDKNLVINLILRTPSILEYRVPKNKHNKQNIPVVRIALEVHLNDVLMSNADELHLTLLNEARLSALAISIYFASLLLPSLYQGYKILFLDDIFIGLDMSNRLPLLEILKTEFSDWQIFMTTYDRHWFEVAKSEFGTSNWLPIEMYVGKEEVAGQRILKPVVISPSLDHLGKAKAHFKAKDYPACANYLRKEIERLIKERLPIEEKSDFGGKPHTLNHLWGELVARYQSLGISIDSKISDTLNTTRLVLLNPQSHYTITYPVYEAEINRAFDVVDAISQLPIIQSIVILHSGANAIFKHPTVNYSFEFTLKSDWVLDFIAETTAIKLPKCKIQKFQQDGVDFFDNGQGRALNDKEIEKIKKRDDKIDKVFGNLSKISVLSITDAMLYENTIIDNTWKLVDIVLSAVELYEKRIL